MRNLVRVIVALVLIAAVVAYIKYARNQQAHLPKTQHAACVDNLRQIGVAFRVWSGDHNNQLPFNVPASEGGTKEHALADTEGFAVDPAIHLKSLGNADGLSTPKLLLCPKDNHKKPASNWASLTTANVTYKLRIGTNLTEQTRQVLAVCPVDGNTLFTDGTVTGEIEPVKPGEPQPMRVTQ